VGRLDPAERAQAGELVRLAHDRCAGQRAVIVDRVGLGPALDPGMVGWQRTDELDAQLGRQRGAPGGQGGGDGTAAAGVGQYGERTGEQTAVRRREVR
jgi:hypothetical protein